MSDEEMPIRSEMREYVAGLEQAISILAEVSNEKDKRKSHKKV